MPTLGCSVVASIKRLIMHADHFFSTSALGSRITPYLPPTTYDYGQNLLQHRRVRRNIEESRCSLPAFNRNLLTAIRLAPFYHPRFDSSMQSVIVLFSRSTWLWLASGNHISAMPTSELYQHQPLNVSILPSHSSRVPYSGVR